MRELHRLVFTSRSTSPGDGSDISAILPASRRNNNQAGITGVIAFHAGRYAQVIEGPHDALEATFQRITRDSRHEDIRKLAFEPASTRHFPNQPMAHLAQSDANTATLGELMEQSGKAASQEAADLLTARLQGLAIAQHERTRDAAAADQGSEVAAGAAANPSRSELQALSESIATAVLSPEGRLIRASAAYLALFGRDQAAIIGRRREDLTLEWEAGAQEYETLWPALRIGDTHTVQCRALDASGREIWLRSTFRPFIDDDGYLREVVEIATDITEQVCRGIEERGQIAAISASQAVLHFSVDGVILDANARFLEAAGYRLDEVVGQHHRMLIEADYAASPAYAEFWVRLATGEHQAIEFKHVARDGRHFWLQATYNPILATNGSVLRIVQYATDITREKLRQADFQWQISAIHKSHAVVTFSMDGLILDANTTFLDAFGYERADVVGRHHRMFVDPSSAHGADYAAFWRSLGKGQHQSGAYRRVGGDGREVWLQATYNPVFDLDGRPVKVVKYATVVTEEKLRQAEHEGQIAAIHKAQCVIAFDLDGTILDANDNFLDAMGYRLAEVRGRNHRMFVEPSEAASAEYAAFWAALASGKHQTAEFKRIGKDGREAWLQATYNPIMDLNGRPFRVVKYATDVTQERLRQADLAGQIEAIRKSQGVITFDMNGMILDANDRFLATVGYDLDELRGQNHRFLIDPAHTSAEEYAVFWDTLRSGAFVSGLYKRAGKNGREVWIQASYNPILDLNNRPFKVVKFATDVTANVAMSDAFEDAKRQAQHDAATSLPNRVRLASFMTNALAAPSGRLVAFYLDLDRFRPINDAHGHQVGDRVLGEIADRLRRALSFEQLAARVGGDKFVVVAPDLEDDEIESFAQRLLEAVGVPIRWDGGEVSVSASMGIAVAPLDATVPDELLRCADAALCRSKQAGRGTFSFFGKTLNERVQSYRALVDDMRRGIAEEQFFLEYQPRFDVDGQTIRSVEALVRWNHPERGRIAPIDFIPAAERSGLIVPLGAWVLQTACRTAAGWPSIGVSVNVSPVQFQSTDIVALVDTVLVESGIEAHQLELEITEGVLLEDAQRARVSLERLKQRGVKLAIDDFGTGYSSLSSLRAFPFDVIKIDRQFIVDMDACNGGREVVQAILALGKALGLSVTAEGVETDKQLTMLQEDDCVEVQGYLLARPMPAGDIDTLLARQDAAAWPVLAAVD